MGQHKQFFHITKTQTYLHCKEREWPKLSVDTMYVRLTFFRQPETKAMLHVFYVTMGMSTLHETICMNQKAFDK